MNISAASKASGLTVKTVRYYADIGLVEAPSRSEAGYRTYDDVAVRKLVFVRRSRAFGFSIEKCRELLDLYQDQDRTSSEVKRIANCVNNCVVSVRYRRAFCVMHGLRP